MANFLSAVITPDAATSVTVGVASTQIVAENLNRKGLILVNTGVTMFIGLGVAASLNNGICLAPLGVFNMAEYDFTTTAINGITTSTGVITIQEFST